MERDARWIAEERRLWNKVADARPVRRHGKHLWLVGSIVFACHRDEEQKKKPTEACHAKAQAWALAEGWRAYRDWLNH